MELPRRDATPALAKKALSLMTRSPRLVLVREPDQLGVERAHPQLAFGVRLVQLAEPNRHVAADDDRTPASLDDDHLQPACVARRRDEPEPGKQFELAVDRHVPHAGRIDPLANSVVVLAARVVELPTLDIDRLAGEEVIATTVVEVQVCVDDDVNAGEVEVLLAQWTEAGIHICHRRVQLRHASVDQHTPIGMVDDVHIDRHPLALGEQVGNADWRDGDFLFHGNSSLLDNRTCFLFRQDEKTTFFELGYAPNGVRYPQVGGLGFGMGAGINLKPEKDLKNAQTPTTTAPAYVAGVQVHAVLAGVNNLLQS